MGWPDRYINVRRCGDFSLVLLQLEYTLDLSEWRREYPSLNSGYLSCRDINLAVKVMSTIGN